MEAGPGAADQRGASEKGRWGGKRSRTKGADGPAKGLCACYNRVHTLTSSSVIYHPSTIRGLMHNTAGTRQYP
eukprot:23480-Eustigmatos_ZCMA.PRE.1